MKLELKGIKHAEFASHETHCYEANLYVNGKNVARVSNEGMGGPDLQEVHSYKQSNAKIKENARLYKEACEYLEKQDTLLEYWCCDRVNDYLTLKDMKRDVRTNILYYMPLSENGTIKVDLLLCSYRKPGTRKRVPITQTHIDRFKNDPEHKGAVLFNELSDADKLLHYHKHIK